MRKVTCVILAGLFLSTVPGLAAGKVNCKQIRRYAQTGRTAEDISETMIIPIEQVKKCLEGEDASANPTPQETKE